MIVKYKPTNELIEVEPTSSLDYKCAYICHDWDSYISITDIDFDTNIPKDAILAKSLKPNSKGRIVNVISIKGTYTDNKRVLLGTFKPTELNFNFNHTNPKMIEEKAKAFAESQYPLKEERVVGLFTSDIRAQLQQAYILGAEMALKKHQTIKQ